MKKDRINVHVWLPAECAEIIAELGEHLPSRSRTELIAEGLRVLLIVMQAGKVREARERALAEGVDRYLLSEEERRDVVA